ncbi:hypothetical protein SAMN04489761_2357 [Tenacibaculum sp. MAR_2009_124]|uniref:hypothetical protein n=1 Tax=Tenacibaculum sp. MAR_2009_124 TaxID=1250059 RepID=UPI00089B9EB4|nr:hypothetical protein [Tenacibaculum sp. MAR_2009_124]SEC19973.1 hypothetical protein SAMN04489761_2357 [Tenacibaculum sp. MAR_2009_124]
MKKIILFGLTVLFLVACEAVFVEDISNNYVTLTAPSNNASVKTGTISFLWEPVNEANNYQLQVATPSFTNASQVVLDTTVTTNTFAHKLDAGEYEWRVKAKNSDYETAFEMHALMVTDSDIANAEAELLLPSDNEITNVVSQKLTWSAVPDATEYRVQIYTPDVQGTLVKDVTVSETEYIYEFSDGEFTWQVRPQSDTQNGKYTSRKITIDSKKPNTPENTAPENNHTQTTTTIDFSWTRTDVAGTVEVDSIYVFTDVNLTQLSFKAEGTNKTYKKEDLEASTYYWYVKAFDKANNESDNSTTFLVTVN